MAAVLVVKPDRDQAFVGCFAGQNVAPPRETVRRVLQFSARKRLGQYVAWKKLSSTTFEAVLVHQAARVQPWHEFDQGFLPAYLGAISEDVLSVQVCSLFLARVLLVQSHACSSSHKRSPEGQCQFAFPSDEACGITLLTIKGRFSPVNVQVRAREPFGHNFYSEETVMMAFDSQVWPVLTEVAEALGLDVKLGLPLEMLEHKPRSEYWKYLDSLHVCMLLLSGIA